MTDQEAILHCNDITFTMKLLLLLSSMSKDVIMCYETRAIAERMLPTAEGF